MAVPLLMAARPPDGPPTTQPARDVPATATLTSQDAEAMAREIQPKVEAIRGLTFKRQVPVRVVDDAAARSHFQARIARFWPEDQIRAEQTAYIQLGLLPEGSDLLGTTYSLLEEQAGGYYDPSSDTFFVLDDMPRSSAPILMAHELTHALDDQYYDIDALLGGAGNDLDRSSLIGAVVEGSGMLVMSVYMLQELQAGRISFQALRDLQESEAGRAERLRAAPPLLRRSLLAPYLLGQTFVLKGDMMRLGEGVNPADLDRLFKDPPRSTEQLLHPEKYWDAAKSDLPRPVALVDRSKDLGEGWSLAGSGNLGELTLAILTGAPEIDPASPESLFPSAWTNDAARGWGGDSWQVYSNGGRHVTLLATLWDSVRDAEEFAAALGGTGRPSLPNWRRGEAVVIVAGQAENPAALAASVLSSLAVP